MSRKRSGTITRCGILRVAAGLGAIVAGWIALDSLVSGVLTAGASGGSEFFLYWGIPFAAAAVFLGWFALLGGRAAARDVAKHGCMGSVLLGGGVFLLYLVSPLVLPWDALGGAVAAFLHGPLAAVLGLVVGLTFGVMRKRRP